MKKIFVFLLLLAALTSEKVFAFDNIENFASRAELCSTNDYCATGNTQSDGTYGQIPNVSGVCGTNRIAVCNYYIDGDYGMFDSNTHLCYCLTLRENEVVPVVDSTNTCVCKNGVVDDRLSNCQDATVATCMGRADNSNPYTSETCMCLSLDSDAAAAESTSYAEALENSNNVIVYDPTSDCGGNKIAVAGWCFPYDAGGIASKLLQIIFGIAGGIAFLLMVYGFIMVATSSGDEKKLQAARETITSAITGLLISLFALFLFRLIAINILQIPGLV